MPIRSGSCRNRCRPRRRSNMSHGRALMLLLVLIATGCGSVWAVPSDSARVDSLFIYASSGSVRHREMVQPAKDSLVAMGEKAAPWLARKLDATDARERLTLAQLFEGIGAVAVPYVTPYLDSAGEYMPKNAARSLGRIGDSSATPALVKHIGHDDFLVRSGIATALGKIADQRAAQPLLDRLPNEPDPEVRKSIVVALGRIGDPMAADALIDAFADPSFGVRQTAIFAIGNLSEPPTAEVADAVHTNKGIARHAAIVALGHCDTELAHGILLDMLNSPDPMIRGFALEGLSVDSAEEDLELLTDRLAGESDPFVLAQLARLRASNESDE
ncbi:MAG: hypothetical protein GF341_01785 [candidate division Zixibacteria bacterium]|nr:hypothetical protein [candidate division Zixibacteria bacterium]